MAIAFIKYRLQIPMTPQMAGRASPNQAGRPSLYADASVKLHAVDAQAGSILSGLEQSRPHRTRLGGVVGLALASAIAIGWWQAGGFVRGRDAVPLTLAAQAEATTSGDAKAATTTEQNDQAVAVVEAKPDDDAGEQMAAVVVAEADGADSRTASTPQEPSAAKSSAPLQVADGVAPGTGQPVKAAENSAPVGSLASTAMPVVTETNTKQTQAVIAPTKLKTTASVEPQLPEKPQSAPKTKDDATSLAKSSRNGETKSKPTEKDGDVELIAALLNRVSAKPEPVIDDSVRKPASGKSTLRQSSAETKKSKKTGLARENATPNLLSAEAQLKRCSAMSFLEAELCRFRVCDGRWGRDPACPENSQASAALP